MESYSLLNEILRRSGSTYEQFQAAAKKEAIAQETYLNLFLTHVAIQRSTSPQFGQYLNLLINFKQFTSKKSANVNYIGYKDRRSILMHTCQRGAPRSVQLLLSVPKLDLNYFDSEGKNAVFYAILNSNEEFSNQIITLILDRHPHLITSKSHKGLTLLHEAIMNGRNSTVELLLMRGAEANWLSNQKANFTQDIFKNIENKKDQCIKIFHTLAKYGLDLLEESKSEKNSQLLASRSVDNREYNLQQTLSEVDNECDKESLTTMNQQTKVDDLSSRFDTLSYHQSLQVDFSELDDLDLNNFNCEFASQGSCTEEDREAEEAQQDDSQIDIEGLNQQIFEFGNKQIEKYQQALYAFDPFLKNIQKITKRCGLGLEIIGSFATGLWTEHSDIDIALIPMGNQYIDFESTLQKMYKTLRGKKSEFDMKDIYLNRGTIHCIKIQFGMRLNYLKCDIAIFHRNHQNRHYVAFIAKQITNCWQIRYIFFIYKHLLKTFNLNEPFSGGIKTYTLFLMILSVTKNMPGASLGQIFMQVSAYYGFIFQYTLDFNQQESENRADYPSIRFNMIDPLNPKNNVGGRQTKAEDLKNLFRSVYYTIGLMRRRPFLASLLEISDLF